MSNRPAVIPTKFEDVRSGHVSHGFRIYDEYGKDYGNLFDSIPDDDLEFLKAVIDSGLSDTGKGILDWCREEQVGLHIGDQFYEWDEIKHIIG
jgi:hypothetical protein